MNIGILTFHEGLNHGGFFQVYSTFNFLKDLGHDVEIINYKNKKHLIREFITQFARKDPRISLSNYGKLRNFRKDLKTLKMSRFSMNIKRLNTEKYHVIVVGSDIVWNYQWSFLGQDPTYFGNGFPYNRLISFAPSCGGIDIALPRPDYVSGLSNFSKISVRDDKTAKLVEKTIGTFPKIVLDPTFILDFNGHEKPITIKNDYILVYAFRLNKGDKEQIIEFAKSKNLRLIAVGYSQKWCDINLVSIGPFEWLSYFKNAKFVVSGTFHGTLFSIKYNKNFAISNNPGISSKLETVLKKIALTERAISNSNTLTQILEKKIDYNAVNEKLDPLIIETREFLKNGLED
jgi:hypothetical protein